MTDVFVATMARGYSLRWFLEQAVIKRWSADKNADVAEIAPWNDGLNCKTEEFQRSRRIYADQVASTSIYVLTDDDCMPIGMDFIARGLAVMEAHPDFGILSALNIRSKTLFDNGIPPYTGQFIDEDVWECHAVGGIRFCRKGIIKEWPESVNPGSYDCQHHEALVKAGYRAGYMRNVIFSHLGEGLSTHWPQIPEIEQLYRKEVTA